MPVPDDAPARQRTLLREDAYRRLRDAIVDGTLEPGERLRDAELERWLGVSRTPIREAVARLEQAGLVHTRPGRSTVVAPLDARAARHAQSVAAALHELATREATPHLGEEHAGQLERANTAFADALRAGDADAAIAADDAFHGVFLDVCDNPLLRSALEQATPLLRRLERTRFSTLSGRASVAQHERIAAAALAGDAETAGRLARENWLTLDPLVPAEPAG
ncbi:GntR family transcriptional regulator [Kineococcus sp. SYSU DK004]|uniref:GntR family transcriptional regulator n=1 Tax=Kineococcus sp. SYSU DK004 TaxID=3383125 RepID=UPI003D7EB265